MKFEPEPDSETPSQAEFIRRLASLPHTCDDADLPDVAPATILEMGGALSYINDAIQVAREIVKRDGISPPQQANLGTTVAPDDGTEIYRGPQEPNGIPMPGGSREARKRTMKIMSPPART